MATHDLRHSHLGDRHLQQQQAKRSAARQGEDWCLLDVLPNPIASPAAADLREGDRLVELPGKPTERRGYFVGWGLHRQRGAMAPLIRWDFGHTSFSDLRVLCLESQYMNTPSEKPDPLDQLRRECHILIDRIAKRPYSLKLLANVKKMLLLVLGYKSGRQSLSDRKPPR